MIKFKLTLSLISIFRICYDIPSDESIYIRSHAKPFVASSESDVVDEVNIISMEEESKSEDEEKNDEEKVEDRETNVDTLNDGSSSSKKRFQQKLTLQSILLNHVFDVKTTNVFNKLTATYNFAGNLRKQT